MLYLSIVLIFSGDQYTKKHVFWLNTKESGHRTKTIQLSEILGYLEHPAIHSEE